MDIKKTAFDFHIKHRLVINDWLLPNFSYYQQLRQDFV